MALKRNDARIVSPEGTWFPSWPLFSSLLLHGLLAYFLMTWTFSYTPESVTRVVMVQIVEEEKEIAPVRPARSGPKQKKIQKIEPLKPEPRLVTPQKEEALLIPPILKAAEEKAPQVLKVTGEKIGVEEKPKEEWMEHLEPGRWGTPEASHEVEPLRLAIEEPAMSLTADSGSAPRGIPGGLAAINPWGRGAGDEAGFPGGVESGKGTVPPKGAKTGSVYFQGEGKGRGDLGSYLGNARMKIEKAKRYPIEAQRKKWEGRVVLSFQINRHGEVLEIKLIQSSGYRLLDNEGIMTLRRASPFPSPLLIEKENFVLEVPIHFKLEKKM